MGQHDDQAGPAPSPPAIRVRTTKPGRSQLRRKRRRAKLIPRFPDETLMHGGVGEGWGSDGDFGGGDIWIVGRRWKRGHQ